MFLFPPTHYRFLIERLPTSTLQLLSHMVSPAFLAFAIAQCLVWMNSELVMFR